MIVSRPVPFLMYHALERGGVDPYCTTPEQFQLHLEYLRARGLNTMSIEEYLAPKDEDIERRRVVLTFDDGNASDFACAVPMLLERGLTATFFVTTDWVDTPGHLTWSQVREMADLGMTIGSHGITHRHLTTLSPAEAFRELCDSKATLEHRLGRSVKFLAAPGGRWKSGLDAIARHAGYRGICTSEIGLNHPSRDRYLFRRLAIRRWNLSRFTGFVEQRRSPLLAEHLSALVKDAARRGLGDLGYERLRRAVLGL
jgi:peptidoglycan/xylan/chitin deacetylase (PgdA/CDA1 family)